MSSPDNPQFLRPELPSPAEYLPQLLARLHQSNSSGRSAIYQEVEHRLFVHPLAILDTTLLLQEPTITAAYPQWAEQLRQRIFNPSSIRSRLAKNPNYSPPESDTFGRVFSSAFSPDQETRQVSQAILEGYIDQPAAMIQNGQFEPALKRAVYTRHLLYDIEPNNDNASLLDTLERSQEQNLLTATEQAKAIPTQTDFTLALKLMDHPNFSVLSESFIRGSLRQLPHQMHELMRKQTGKKALRADLTPMHLRAISLSENLFLAAMDITSDPVLTRLMQIWGDYVTPSDASLYQIYDFIIHARMNARPALQTRAAAVFAAASCLEDLYYQGPTQISDQVRARTSILALSQINSAPTHPEVPRLADTTIRQINESATLFATHPEHQDFGVVVFPHKNRLADLALRLKTYSIHAYFKNLNMDAIVVPIPGNNILLKTNREIIDQAALQTQVLQLIAESDRSEPISRDEINTLIEYCLPTPNTQKLEDHLTRTSSQLNSGLHALSQRGDRVIIDPQTDPQLHLVGLESITFYQEADGVVARLTWHGFSFNLFIDRDLNFYGLEHVQNQDKAQWLRTTIFTYLAALKHPSEDLQPTAQKSSIKKDQGSPTFSGRRAHLRVNPVGAETHQLDDPQIDALVKLHFGTDLTSLNRAFGLVQTNLLDQRQITNPHLRKLIAIAIGKLRSQDAFGQPSREEKPHWVTKDNHKTLVLANPPVSPTPKTWHYTISYIPEATTELSTRGNQPVTVTIPGLSTPLFD